jgi:hypothetical protein
MPAGYAYPLYYDTLVADLREVFNEALDSAKQSSQGNGRMMQQRKGLPLVMHITFPRLIQFGPSFGIGLTNIF